MDKAEFKRFVSVLQDRILNLSDKSLDPNERHRQEYEAGFDRAIDMAMEEIDKLEMEYLSRIQAVPWSQITRSVTLPVDLAATGVSTGPTAATEVTVVQERGFTFRVFLQARSN